MPLPLNVKPGTEYGTWTLLSCDTCLTSTSGRKRRTAKCECKCGNVRYVLLESLRSGKSTSCGCKHVQSLSQQATHGQYGLPVYRVWHHMLQRCENPNDRSYYLYGERGISVCEEWHDAQTFLDWANPRWKPGLQIDRIDNEKGYCPSNCHFVTPKANNRNRRTNVNVTFMGKTMCLKAWAEHFGIKYETFWSRMNRGYSFEKAALMQVGQYGKLRAKD